jgi:hypothetical protein
MWATKPTALIVAPTAATMVVVVTISAAADGDGLDAYFCDGHVPRPIPQADFLRGLLFTGDIS